MLPDELPSPLEAVVWRRERWFRFMLPHPCSSRFGGPCENDTGIWENVKRRARVVTVRIGKVKKTRLGKREDEKITIEGGKEWAKQRGKRGRERQKTGVQRKNGSKICYHVMQSNFVTPRATPLLFFFFTLVVQRRSVSCRRNDEIGSLSSDRMDHVDESTANALRSSIGILLNACWWVADNMTLEFKEEGGGGKWWWWWWRERK